MVLNHALYGLKPAYNPFQKFFGEFPIDVFFTPFRAKQDLWLIKSDEYDGCDYITTHADGIIISSKNPSKYMN